MSTVEMEESTVSFALQTENTLDDLNNDAVLYSQETYVKKTTDDFSDDDAVPIARVKRRVQQFSDSDTEKENKCTHVVIGQSDSSSDAENNRITFKSGLTKSRIHVEVNSSDSDTSKQDILKNEEQQLRMKNKRNKMNDKFKGLLTSRSKSSSQKHNDKPSSEDKSEDSGSEASNPSDNEMSSITKMKQKIRNSMSKMSSICDPDTSDEESDINKHRPTAQKHKRAQKSTKKIEPKPLRISAKQAMENMHLIKSESNRMLREKAVSLPYHRPKALSLKDIMARRKPAVTSDGKALPIKMSKEQLKEYAMQLEQRQKEMMELCKSESDGDIPEHDTNEDKLVPNEEDNNELETDNTIKETNNKETEINIANANAERDINSIENEPASIDKDIPPADSNKEENEQGSELMNSETNQNDSNTDIKLVYDNSIEEDNVTLHKTDNVNKENEISHTDPQEKINTVCSEQESQLISLHYTENTDEIKERGLIDSPNDDTPKLNENSEKLIKTNVNSEELVELNVNTEELVAQDMNSEGAELNLDSEEIDKQDDNSEEIAKLNENAGQLYIIEDDFLSDDDVNMEDIDRIIENAEIMKNDEDIDTPILTKDSINIKSKKNPKIMGAPGMVIDLDGSDSMPKLSGVELLKERFCYFSKLKTPEELEREREKRIKPGAQHLKLKQELGDIIAEKRSLEWAKRLEEEKQLHQEIDTILDDDNEVGDSFEKCDGKLDDEKDDISSESEGEEEPIENDIEIKDKPRKHNPMLDDEAEETDNENNDIVDDETNNDLEEDNENDEGDNEESSEEESSESEQEVDAPKHKKGRILKAFEDSDDETPIHKGDIEDSVKDNTEQSESVDKSNSDTYLVEPLPSSLTVQSSSQDDVLQLAQRHKSASDDLFASQENVTTNEINKEEIEDALGTQTFSISSAKPAEFLYPSQPYHDPNLNSITDGFSQNILNSQLPTQASQSQLPIGEDILALCTGKFYDNEFVSQTNVKTNTISQDDYLDDLNDKQENETLETNFKEVEPPKKDDLIPLDKKPDDTTDSTKPKQDLLKSILDELDDPEFDKPKPNKYFAGTTQTTESSQMKKRLIIDSDDENNETNMTDTTKKKLKKKKMEKRALQISDDEEEEEEQELDEELSDREQNDDREVEYDSEENEIKIKPDKPKKKRKATDFFEDEAELTSEDEWVGSGDEDEHGLDRMEREEGDDEVFHQGKLQKELGQIHMRDIMDQDKREVRLLQELLFEDGDLGGGHRQRKFRWRDTEEEETGTVPNEFADTQEEEFESEEQWRKQRHEREVFLRQMQNKDEEENLNVTVNRNTIIKANLISKSMSALLMEVNQTKVESVQSNSPAPEKKTVKDVPSPKSFSIFQQNYHGSLLTRGRGALARLAALATPLAADDDTPKITSLASHKRNFVFTALTPDDPPKVTIKRKADVGTPKLVKKMRIEEKQNNSKSSLLDHFNL